MIIMQLLSLGKEWQLLFFVAAKCNCHFTEDAPPDAVQTEVESVGEVAQETPEHVEQDHKAPVTAEKHQPSVTDPVTVSSLLSCSIGGGSRNCSSWYKMCIVLETLLVQYCVSYNYFA